MHVEIPSMERIHYTLLIHFPPGISSPTLVEVSSLNLLVCHLPISLPFDRYLFVL